MATEANRSAQLLDAQGRRISYLRLSVTDRCNFRCSYCSAASWGGKSSLLLPAELARLTRVFASMGIRRVRLTGGEPLARPDILAIAEGVSAVVPRVAMTTNASLLAPIARRLREAGVRELNISLDTLSEATFRAISRQGDLASVLEGIEASLGAGFDSIKLNVVVMRGVNDGEVPALVRFAHERGLLPRFIELMPFGAGQPVATAELVSRLDAEGFALEPLSEPQGPQGPARYFSCATGRVGFISPMTQNFCGGCNRVRVAANGDLRSCLGGREQTPMSKLIREPGVTDADLERAIRQALGTKPPGHEFTRADGRERLLSMMGIGG